MLELRTLYDLYNHRVKHIGFSGHHLGIAVDVAACACPAQPWARLAFCRPLPPSQVLNMTPSTEAHRTHGRYAMGATWNERHFTKDRTWKGTDHAASLEPAGMQKLCRDLKATWKCMTFKVCRHSAGTRTPRL